MGAYDGQAKNLQREFENGTLSRKDYEKQLKKNQVERAREAERQSLSRLMAIVQVEKASELKEWLSRSDSSSKDTTQQHLLSSYKGWQDTLLQVFTGATALVLLAVIFFPFFREMLDLNSGRSNSLFQISLFLKSKYSPLLLLSAGPVIIAILAFFISLIPTRTLRGFLLFVISTTAMVALGIGLGVLFCFPHPLLSNFIGMLVELSQARIGLAFFVGSIFLLHIMALLNIWKMKSARILWLISFGVALVAVAATAAACFLGVHTYAGVTLREVSIDGDIAALEIEVVNSGNIPLYLTETLSDHPSQNTYAVSVHNRVTESSWERVIPLDHEFADSKYSKVAAGESKMIIWRVPLPVEQNPCEFRAELHLAEGVAAQSENVILTRQATEEAEPPIIESTDPEISADTEQLEVCREELLNITNKLADTKPAVLVQNVNSMRGEIERLSNQTERDRMHGLLDKAILGAKEREATALYEKALQAYNSELYDNAITGFQDVFEIFKDQPQTRSEEVGTKSRELLAFTERYLNGSQLAVDPKQRFQVTGFFDSGKGKTIAFLNDNFTGKQLQVNAGDTIAKWEVVSISKSSLVIQDDRNEFTLEVRD